MMSANPDVERRGEWNFVITDEGWLWTLKQPDGSKSSSERSFMTLKECADDAIQHGYGAWKAEERRGVAR